MPKIVDHSQRRRELIESTWRVIARRGLAGATMRQIAEEAGYANGALKPYFPTKLDLLEATFKHVYDSTQERIRESIKGLRGLTALKAMSLEILPVNEQLKDEARLVVSFWESGVNSQYRAELAAVAIGEWSEMIIKLLNEAKDDGQLRAIVDIENTAGAFVGFLQGSQIDAVMDPKDFSPARLTKQLDAYLELLAK